MEHNGKRARSDGVRTRALVLAALEAEAARRGDGCAELTVRDLGRLVGLSHGGAHLVVRKLAGSGALTVARRGKGTRARLRYVLNVGRALDAGA